MNKIQRAGEYRVASLPFQPRARLLLLLGDQLIRDPGIAVFELVKNAYDADSPYAKVAMSDLDKPETGKIIVEDAGTGMDYETVSGIWLEPGTDYRAEQKDAGSRTPIYGRLPLGEKGVGRFAAHKLGRTIKLITRKLSSPEVVVEINWDADFGTIGERTKSKKYLKDIPVTVSERKPEYFKGQKTGTRIEIGRLREKWTRGAVRDLARSITAICSPFEQGEDFKADLSLNSHEDWLNGLLKIDDILNYSLFRAHCVLNKSTLKYEYSFVPLPGMDRVEARRTTKVMNLGNSKQKLDLSSEKIGPINIDLFIFDREPQILALGVADIKGLKNFLDESGGIRVYRDGIRVYDYGEPGNDWLDLGGRRINIPAKRISNNLVIGAVSLEVEQSRGLIEKTNREGFVENRAFEMFQECVLFTVAQIEAERKQDKERIRRAYASRKLREPVLQDLSDLKYLVERKKLTGELGPYIDRIERDFLVIRDRLLTSASAGLSLSVVIHEVEKGVAELVRVVHLEPASNRTRALAQHIAELIEGFASLVRKSGTSNEKISSLIQIALLNVDFRLKAHGIKIIIGKALDTQINCSRRLIVSTIMNLIDNSIWWLDNKWGNVRNRKRIYVGATNELSQGPSIVVADNGPGFIDSPEYLVQPFITRKPDGMGLGLHIAEQTMKAMGGELLFPEAGDVQLPAGFNGAIVALCFGGKKI